MVGWNPVTSGKSRAKLFPRETNLGYMAFPQECVSSATLGENVFQRFLGLVQADSTFAAKPPLKWAGGKRWLVPYLKPLWGAHQDCRLVEPLCGGLAVALGLRPTHALLNDINVHVINFFQWLKRGLTANIRMENNAGSYYEKRQRFNQLIRYGQTNSSEAAELFYYLNRTCYNGLCRFNHSGEFNVPFGRYKRIRYIRDFSSYKRVFKHWDFTTGDFEDVKLEETDLVFADPPYDVEFTQYSIGGFSWSDQIRLAKWLEEFAGPVILCNQATSRICKLYRELGFKLHFLDAPRLISCKGDRRPAREVLALRGVKAEPELRKYQDSALVRRVTALKLFEQGIQHDNW
jgi:DNA adenine methylase